MVYKWTVNAPVVYMALRKYGIHLHHMLNKKIVRGVISHVIDDNQCRHESDSSN